jgi:hypothetical protein
MVLRAAFVFLVIAALIASPQVLPAPSAHACSCVPSTLEEHIAHTRWVVLGTVIAIDEVPLNDPAREEQFEYDITVEIDEYVKGAGEATIVVRDFALQTAACSVFNPDSVDQMYVLFLRRNDENRLSTNSCAGSFTFTGDDHSREQLEEIRLIAGSQPEPTDTEPNSTPTPLLPQLPNTGSGDHVGDALPLAVASALLAVLASGGLATVAWRGIRDRDSLS